MCKPFMRILSVPLTIGEEGRREGHEGQNWIAVRRLFRGVHLQTAFFDDHKPGELTSRVSSDVQIVTAVLGSKMAQLIQHLSSVVFRYEV